MPETNEGYQPSEEEIKQEGENSIEARYEGAKSGLRSGVRFMIDRAAHRIDGKMYYDQAESDYEQNGAAVEIYFCKGEIENVLDHCDGEPADKTIAYKELCTAEKRLIEAKHKIEKSLLDVKYMLKDLKSVKYKLEQTPGVVNIENKK